MSPSRNDMPRNTNRDRTPDVSPEKTGPDDPGTSPYQFENSGRRAAGHGGGSLDHLDEGGQRNAPGYAHSGGGQGHTPLRSAEIEAEEELETRNGPFLRSGRPAGKKDDHGR